MESQHSEPGTDLRRHSRHFPCPICGGRAETTKGQGTRCAGFTVGRVAYCTREQFAGYLDLKVSASPPAYRHTLSESCECGRPHGEQFFSPGISLTTTARPHRPKRTAVPIEERHGVYSAALDLLQLRDESKDDLINRGLSLEAIEKAGYKSIPRRGKEHQAFLAKMAEGFGEESLSRCPGFANEFGRLDFWSASGSRDGYIVPYRDENGFITGIQQKTLGGIYLTARGSILESVYHLAGTGSQGQDLYVTEGATKGTVASHLGEFWTFAVAGQSLTRQHVDVIKGLRAERVIVALDQEDNRNTERARERWCKLLSEQGLPVFTAVWEGEELGGAKGLDDLLFQGNYPRVEQVLQLPPETNSTFAIAANFTLSEMKSEIGKHHIGQGEVRHGGREGRRQESVAHTVYSKSPLHRNGDKPKDTGKRPSLWAEAKTIFRLPTHVKPRMKGFMLWSDRDNKAVAVDWYSNTWRNLVNAQFKRQKLFFNVLPRINGPQIYRRRVPIDDWDKKVHGRIERGIQRAMQRSEVDHGWMWFDNGLDRGYYLYLTSVPGLKGFEPVEDVKLVLIDALKSIHPPDREEGGGRFCPYGGSKNWKGKAEETGEDDAGRWEIIAVANSATDFVSVEVECVVSGVKTESQPPFWRAQPYEGLAMHLGSKEAAAKFAMLFPEVYTLTKAALAALPVSVGAEPDHGPDGPPR